MRLRANKELLTAWLLLSLTEGDDHGYRLSRRVGARGMPADPPSIYRLLRDLERAGYVESRWSDSPVGPRRRIYTLTRLGRRELADLAGTIAELGDLHDGFVRAFVATGKPGPRAASAHAATANRTRTPPSYAKGAVRPGRKLLAAWLLVLLEQDADYGYDLRRRLDEHGVNIDAGNVYRMLRALEAKDFLQSRWMRSRAGPERHFYRPTAKGRRALAELAVLMTGTRDAHNAFTVAYETRTRRRRGAAPTPRGPRVR